MMMVVLVMLMMTLVVFATGQSVTHSLRFRLAHLDRIMSCPTVQDGVPKYRSSCVRSLSPWSTTTHIALQCSCGDGRNWGGGDGWGALQQLVARRWRQMGFWTRPRVSYFYSSSCLAWQWIVGLPACLPVRWWTETWQTSGSGREKCIMQCRSFAGITTLIFYSYSVIRITATLVTATQHGGRGPSASVGGLNRYNMRVLDWGAERRGRRRCLGVLVLDSLSLKKNGTTTTTTGIKGCGQITLAEMIALQFFATTICILWISFNVVYFCPAASLPLTLFAGAEVAAININPTGNSSLVLKHALWRN